MAKSPAPPANYGNAPNDDSGILETEGEMPLFDERLFFAEQAPKSNSLKKPAKLQSAPPDAVNHYHRHRERLRNRFRVGGYTVLTD